MTSCIVAGQEPVATATFDSAVESHVLPSNSVVQPHPDSWSRPRHAIRCESSRDVGVKTESHCLSSSRRLDTG